MPRFASTHQLKLTLMVRGLLLNLNRRSDLHHRALPYDSSVRTMQFYVREALIAIGKNQPIERVWRMSARVFVVTFACWNAARVFLIPFGRISFCCAVASPDFL